MQRLRQIYRLKGEFLFEKTIQTKKINYGQYADKKNKLSLGDAW